MPQFLLQLHLARPRPAKISGTRTRAHMHALHRWMHTRKHLPTQEHTRTLCFTCSVVTSKSMSGEVRMNALIPSKSISCIPPKGTSRTTDDCQDRNMDPSPAREKVWAKATSAGRPFTCISSVSAPCGVCELACAHRVDMFAARMFTISPQTRFRRCTDTLMPRSADIDPPDQPKHTDALALPGCGF